MTWYDPASLNTFKMSNFFYFHVPKYLNFYITNSIILRWLVQFGNIFINNVSA